MHILKNICSELCIRSIQHSWEFRYYYHAIGTATTSGHFLQLYCNQYSTDTVSDNSGLINVTRTSMALIEFLKIPAMKVHSDVVSDYAGWDNCGPAKSYFVMVPDMVSANPSFHKYASDRCTRTGSDNLGCDKEFWLYWMWLYQVWLWRVQLWQVLWQLQLWQPWLWEVYSDMIWQFWLQ